MFSPCSRSQCHNNSRNAVSHLLSKSLSQKSWFVCFVPETICCLVPRKLEFESRLSGKSSASLPPTMPACLSMKYPECQLKTKISANYSFCCPGEQIVQIDNSVSLVFSSLCTSHPFSVTLLFAQLLNTSILRQLFSQTIIDGLSPPCCSARHLCFQSNRK